MALGDCVQYDTYLSTKWLTCIANAMQLPNYLSVKGYIFIYLLAAQEKAQNATALASYVANLQGTGW